MRTWRNLLVGMWKVLLLWRTVWEFLRKLNIGSPHDPAFRFRASTPKNWKTESRGLKRYLYTCGHSRQHYSRTAPVSMAAEWINNVVYSYNVISHSLKNPIHIKNNPKPHSRNNMDGPWGHDAKCNTPDTETHILWVYTCKKARAVSFIKAEGRMVAAKAGSKAGSYCLVGLELQFGKMKFYRLTVLMATKQSERT